MSPARDDKRESESPLISPALSIVLPCYNEAPSIGRILADFADVSDAPAFELILVDNGSTDETPQLLAAALANPDCAFLRTVRVSPNRGYGAGLLAGLAAARAPVLAWSHADLQTPPRDVFRAYAAYLSAPDPGKSWVKGRRSPRPFRDEVLTKGMQHIASLALGHDLVDINAQPKLFPRALYERFVEPPCDFNLDLYLYALAEHEGYARLEIPVVFGERAHGQSKWAFSLASRRRHIWASLRYICHLRRKGFG